MSYATAEMVSNTRSCTTRIHTILIARFPSTNISTAHHIRIVYKIQYHIVTRVVLTIFSRIRNSRVRLVIEKKNVSPIRNCFTTDDDEVVNTIYNITYIVAQEAYIFYGYTYCSGQYFFRIALRIHTRFRAEQYYTVPTSPIPLPWL